MNLAFNLLLTLLIELPIVAFFFRRKKRNNALTTAFLVNLISWILINIIKLSTDNNEGYFLYIEIGVVVAECIAYNIMLECGFRKAAIISLFANGIAFLIINAIHIDFDELIKKSNSLTP
jgi:hypothetical protein